MLNFDDSSGEWRSGLLQVGSLCSYGYAAVCPCVLVYDLYSATTNRPPSGDDLFLSCYVSLLSCLVFTPTLLCVDQCTTRTLDTAADASKPENGGLLNHIVYLGHFGHTSPAWTHDGVGWDMHANTSEDWWPMGICSHYLCELSAAACHGKCLGGDAPRIPLWIACCMGMTYPVTLCPITFMLRRIVADQRGLIESYGATCLISTFCTPCALVQMDREILQHPMPSYFRSQIEAPSLMNHQLF